MIILFMNNWETPCILSGYPGVAGLDSSSHQVTQASRSPSGYLGGLSSSSAPPPVVTLAHGQTASAKVEGTDNPVGNQTSCPSLSGLLVTPPNTDTTVRLPFAPGDCSGLEVHPVVSGDTGND